MALANQSLGRCLPLLSAVEGPKANLAVGGEGTGRSVCVCVGQAGGAVGAFGFVLAAQEGTEDPGRA